MTQLYMPLQAECGQRHSANSRQTATSQQSQNIKQEAYGTTAYGMVLPKFTHAHIRHVSHDRHFVKLRNEYILRIMLHNDIQE